MDLQRVALLSPAECNQVYELCYLLKAIWRSPLKEFGLPYHVLGGTSEADAKEYNLFLNNRLLWLFERMSDAISKVLTLPIAPATVHLLPLIHIFKFHPIFELPVGSIEAGPHALQEHPEPISCVLPIRIATPEEGLNPWRVDWEKWREGSPRARNELLASGRKQFHRYETGELLIFPSRFACQASPITGARSGDEQIVVRGHILHHSPTAILAG